MIIISESLFYVPIMSGFPFTSLNCTTISFKMSICIFNPRFPITNDSIQTARSLGHQLVQVSRLVTRTFHFLLSQVLQRYRHVSSRQAEHILISNNMVLLAESWESLRGLRERAGHIHAMRVSFLNGSELL
jgi:hypothetical protein